MIYLRFVKNDKTLKTCTLSYGPQNLKIESTVMKLVITVTTVTNGLWWWQSTLLAKSQPFCFKLGHGYRWPNEAVSRRLKAVGSFKKEKIETWWIKSNYNHDYLAWQRKDRISLWILPCRVMRSKEVWCNSWMGYFKQVEAENGKGK